MVNSDQLGEESDKGGNRIRPRLHRRSFTTTQIDAAGIDQALKRRPSGSAPSTEMQPPAESLGTLAAVYDDAAVPVRAGFWGA